MNFFKFLFTKSFLKQVGFAIAVLVVLCFLVLFWLKKATHHGQQIEVPNLAKMSLEKVDKILDEANLRREILDSANYNPNFPKYSVISQIPEAGSFVKESRKIYVTLNPSGYRMITVPEIIGKTRRQAEPTLRALGFIIGEVTYIPYIAKDEVRELHYKGRKIKPGIQLRKTSVIDLVLGDGKGNLMTNGSKNLEQEQDDDDNG